MSVPCFTFVGRSGAGKTTFLERLIAELARRGLRVATLKHSHHAIELDTPGKDSWRHKAAGAAMSLLVTGEGVRLVADCEAGHDDPAPLAERFCSGVDLVLAEGFNAAPGVKIEVLRRAHDPVPRCAPADGLVALVTDCAEVYPELPHFSLDDVAGVADFLVLAMARS